MSHSIEQWIFDVADVLLVPVLLAALAALALVVVEAGRVTMEVSRRRGRSIHRLEGAIAIVREGLADRDTHMTDNALDEIASSTEMRAALAALVELHGEPAWDDRSAKLLADFDYTSLRRLERTRILVRLGPALGLMGTLIPLSPALAALSRGDTDLLAKDLRIAFSVTILGLFIGAIAFGISLVRDRLYAQDLSDLEFFAAAFEWGPDDVPDTPDRPALSAVSEGGDR